MANEYDVLIVGAGLAGLTAGIYSARYGLSTGIVEQMMGGAQIINLRKLRISPDSQKAYPVLNWVQRLRTRL